MMTFVILALAALQVASAEPLETTSRVASVTVQQEAGQAWLRVHGASGAAYTVSEPHYHSNGVRLFVEVSAPRLPVTPIRISGDGPVLDVSAADDLLVTRLTVELAALHTYEIRGDDGIVVLHVQSAAPASHATSAPPAPVVPVTSSPGTAAALLEQVKRAGGSVLVAAGRTLRAGGATMSQAASRPAVKQAALPVALLLLLLVTAAWALRRVAGSRRRPAKAPARDPLMSAQELMRRGLAESDVAARTRLSRDAVRLVANRTAIRA